MPMVLELIQYMLAGLLYIFVLIVFILNKEALFYNYQLIQIDFIQWTNKRGMNQNKPSRKISYLAKRLIIPIVTLISSISLGPLAGVINTTEKTSLGDRSNFFLLWPKVSSNF